MALDFSGLDTLLKELTADYEETRATRDARYTEGKGILEGIVQQFGPDFLKGEEKKMLASAEQASVGRGMGGTTKPVAVSTGIKSQIRDRQTAAKTGAMTNVANYMMGWQDIYPSAGSLMSAELGKEGLSLQESEGEANRTLQEALSKMQNTTTRQIAAQNILNQRRQLTLQEQIARGTFSSPSYSGNSSGLMYGPEYGTGVNPGYNTYPGMSATGIAQAKQIEGTSQAFINQRAAYMTDQPGTEYYNSPYNVQKAPAPVPAQGVQPISSGAGAYKSYNYSGY